jgi:hypothetical protein
VSRSPYPSVDSVRPASDMRLTPEQIEWLLDLARPRCCHVTGEHDPRHFVDRRYVCRDQMAAIAWRLRIALGVDEVREVRPGVDRRWVNPEEAVSMAGCHWCDSAGAPK